jgi:hypothetical protein
MDCMDCMDTEILFNPPLLDGTAGFILLVCLREATTFPYQRCKLSFDLPCTHDDHVGLYS